MRVIIFGLCALFVLGVFVTMFLSIWSTGRRRETRLHLRQSLAAEMVWAAIPCLMLVGAAIPAALLILTPPAARPPEPAPVPAPAREPGVREPTLIDTALVLDLRASAEPARGTARVARQPDGLASAALTSHP
jgi:heme/copper-type cytochrome/quinol oxidase subunit 2